MVDPSARGSSARGANVLGTLQVNALDAARIPGGVGGCGSEEEDGAENRRPPLWSLTPTEWTWGVVGKGERRAALDRARAAGERGGARGVLLAAAEGTSASVTEAVAKGAGAGVSEAVAKGAGAGVSEAVAEGEFMSILELLAAEKKALLLSRSALQLHNLRTEALNRVRGLHLDGE